MQLQFLEFNLVLYTNETTIRIVIKIFNISVPVFTHNNIKITS